MGIFDRLFPGRKTKSREDDVGRDLEEMERAIDQKRVQLARSEYKIEKAIHSLKPCSDQERFVPPFSTWLQCQQDQEMNLEDALDQYIQEFDLLRPTKEGEPVALSIIAAKLRIIEQSRNRFGPEIQADLDKYTFALNSNLMIQRIKWGIDRKGDGHAKGNE